MAQTLLLAQAGTVYRDSQKNSFNQPTYSPVAVRNALRDTGRVSCALDFAEPSDNYERIITTVGSIVRDAGGFRQFY